MWDQAYNLKVDLTGSYAAQLVLDLVLSLLL